MFLQRLVHEGDAVPTIFVVFRDRLGFLSEPLDCVTSDAVLAAHSHTVVSSISEHENAEPDIITSSCRNFKIVRVWMMETFAFPLEGIILRHVPLILCGTILEDSGVKMRTDCLPISRTRNPSECLRVVAEPIC